MAFETASDRTAYLADFGIAVTGDATFTAIYDNEYVEFGDIVGTKPILTAPYVTPVSDLAVGDDLTVNSTDYQVIRVENDATGWCVVILEEQ